MYNERRKGISLCDYYGVYLKSNSRVTDTHKKVNRFELNMANKTIRVDRSVDGFVFSVCCVYFKRRNEYLNKCNNNIKMQLEKRFTKVFKTGI